MADHSSLTSLFKQPNLNTLQTRWINFLSEYEFDIKYLKGKENRVADTLNRRLNCIYEITYSKNKI